MLFGEYSNGTYNVKIYDDGTKIRTAPDDVFIPAFPESCDMTITERCNGGCSYCYVGCTPEGCHCSFEQYVELLDSVHPYTEVAINGNDLTHPELEPFLEKMKQRKVIVNMTVNQRHFEENLNKIETFCASGLIKGLGISLYRADERFVDQVRGFPNAVIHVINGVLSDDDISVLGDKELKLLILGYKNIGRGNEWFLNNKKRIVGRQLWLNDYLSELVKRFKVVSFDNLALEQLDVKRLLTEQEWQEFYMGDDGNFTFFINLVGGYFARDSLSPIHYEIGKKRIDDMFKIIRNGIYHENNQ